MQEARFIEQDTAPGLMKLAQIAARRPLREAGIRMARTEQTDIYASHDGGLEGKEHRFVGQEIRCLDIDVATGSGDSPHIALHDFGIERSRSAGDNLGEVGR